MRQAKQTTPHFYLTLSANAEPMVAARNESRDVIWDAFFVQAVAKAAVQFERMRCRFEEDHLIPIVSDAVGVAADVDDELYVVPVEKPQELSVREISARIVRQVERIRQGEVAARKLYNTYLTVSNLGGMGIEAFTPIINPPEAAILGIGRIASVTHVHKGSIIIQQRVTLTLSVDHRVVSGKYASAFLQRIVTELEAMS
jgi:pyruvate dehydrogenase E2 component (dihydrolipoamide acetyltransferase)